MTDLETTAKPPRLPDDWVEKIDLALGLDHDPVTDKKDRFFLAVWIVADLVDNCRDLLDEGFADVEGRRQREAIVDGRDLLDEAFGRLLDVSRTVAQYGREDLVVADGLEAQGLPTELAEAMAWVALVGPDVAISDKPPAAEDPEVGIDDFGFWPGRRFRLTRQVEVAVEARRNQGGAWELKADDGAFWIMPTGDLLFRKEGEDKVTPTGWTVDDLEPTA